MYEVFKRGRTHSLSVECPLQLIDKMVKPMPLYKSEMCEFSKTIDCLEKIQLRFCKLPLNLKSSTPNYMIYGVLGRFSIEIDIQIRMVSFWARLLLRKETNLLYLSHKQGYKKIRLIRSLKKFIFRYQYLVVIYSVSAEKNYKRCIFI